MTKRTGTPQEAATDDIRSRLLDLAADQFAFQRAMHRCRCVTWPAPWDLPPAPSTQTSGAKATFWRRCSNDVFERIWSGPGHRHAAQVSTVRPSELSPTAERATMRALLVEAAAAARTDADLRSHLYPVLGDLLDRWIADYRDWQKVRHVDRRIDMDALVRSLWSIELGLGVLDARARPALSRAGSQHLSAPT